jgi:hypothetical protein
MEHLRGMKPGNKPGGHERAGKGYHDRYDDIDRDDDKIE